MSIAEPMIERTIGKIPFDFNPVDVVEKIGLELLNFFGNDAMWLGRMPLHHRDPFDRMIIAQNLANGLLAMTDDSNFLKYECKVV